MNYMQSSLQLKDKKPKIFELWKKDNYYLFQNTWRRNGSNEYVGVDTMLLDYIELLRKTL